MPSDFVHLHLHSHYSLLDGACTTTGLLELAKKFDMPALAITDHGYMGGVQDFYGVFHGSGVKPIIGCEAYIAPGSRSDRNPATPHVRGFHLVLLAENNAGYHSLCKLLSEGFRTGCYYGKPRIDKELLKQYNEGLIAMSACIAGELPRYLLEGNTARAEASLKEYLEIFGRDRFFIELMDHGMEDERVSNRKLVELAKKFELELVATNDAHYLKKEHAKAHEIMLCIQTGALLSDANHFSFNAPEYYVKNEAEMRQLFGELPQAITNTRAIAERCDVTFKFVPEVNHYPVYTLEDGTVPGKEYLRDICLRNIPARYGFDPTAPELTDEQKQLLARMDYELDVIDTTKYCSYFLVVSDFIRHAKEQGVPVGPGRGSGAGSIVAYLTGITKLDPLRYNLLFERFLNPERVSPPDFDIDFCEKRRGEVIDYVRGKYGADSVAQICTYGCLKAKQVIKDVARVLGHEPAFGNRISKLIPEEPKMTLAKALEVSPGLRGLYDTDPQVQEVFGYATVLEGLNRQLGIHAAGVIIGDQRLDNLVPLTLGAGGEIITEYPAVPCEHLGLLKMDFLGLRTLTIIRNALDMIKQNRGVEINIDKLPLDDAATYELLRRGDTIAVFQLESGGMQKLCRQFGADRFEHIIALLAIYRPGPMQFIPQFVRRKRGDEPVIYDHPKMGKFLNETYGIMLYQEQIMQVVQELAGFSLGGADILRRAIGKKKAEVMAEQKEKFIAGCASANNIPRDVAESIWEKIEMFAGYGFNKSHSAAYALVSYQTAWLKAHYPVEFMAAMLTGELSNADRIAFLINACREMDIPVLPPDVNSSSITFGVDGDSIRFGLGAIKGVGEVAAKKIIECRERDGRFRDFEDFCERCGGAMNTRMMEHLTRAGAFDGLGLRRSQALAIAEDMLRFTAARARDKANGQGSLFDLLGGGGDTGDSVPIPDIPEMSMEEILANEKELLGFYVTGHPLSPFAAAVRALSTIDCRELKVFGEPEVDEDGQPLIRERRTEELQVRIAGMVSAYTEKFSRNGNKPLGILLLEDMDAAVECMLYSRVIESNLRNGLVLTPGLPVVIEATASRQDDADSVRVAVDRIYPLEEAMKRQLSEIHIHIYENEVDPAKLETLKTLLRNHHRKDSRTKAVFCVVTGDDSLVYIDVPAEGCVTVSRELTDALDALLGEHRFRLKGEEFRPTPRNNSWRREAAKSAEEK